MDPINLRHCLDTTDATELKRRLGAALGRLPTGALPLQHGCDQGGLVDDQAVSASVLGFEQTAGHLTARVGVFFTEVVGGCNCNDDPLQTNAYCVVEVRIDRATGATELRPLETES